MYGRENSAVVNPTKAVRVTMNTFSGSMKKARSRANSGPAEITCAVSAQAAMNVPRLNATLISGANSRCPVKARTALPSSGMPNTKNRISMSVFFQLFQMPDVQAVELLADLEHEHAEDQDADQYVECDTEFDDHGHAVGGRSGCEEQPVLHRQEANDLRHRLGTRDHHHERQQHAGKRDAERSARNGRRQLRHRQRQIERQDHQQNADQHGGWNIDE